MSKPGIRMTVGNQTFDTVDGGFSEWQAGLMKIKSKMGDLTRPYDEISSELIFRIKSRFSDNTFGRAPFVTRTSGFTRKIREARGGDGRGPKLNDTGWLKDSIHRLASPTKTELGEQREVFILRIGTIGVPYAEDHLYGTDWDIPVFITPNGAKFIDYDRIQGSQISNEEAYPRRWNYIRTLDRAIHTIEVPSRNFLALFRQDEEFIDATVSRWLNNLT